MKYRVNKLDNEEFEIDDAKVVDRSEDKGRHFILRFVAWTTVVFLAGAAAYDIALAGDEKSDFSSAQAVWSACKTFVGVVIGYYFGKSK